MKQACPKSPNKDGDEETPFMRSSHRICCRWSSGARWRSIGSCDPARKPNPALDLPWKWWDSEKGIITNSFGNLDVSFFPYIFWWFSAKPRISREEKNAQLAVGPWVLVQWRWGLRLEADMDSDNDHVSPNWWAEPRPRTTETSRRVWKAAAFWYWWRTANWNPNISIPKSQSLEIPNFWDYNIL